MNLTITSIENLDLLSVGIAVAASFILGFTVYFANRRSATSKVFLLFTSVSALWGIVNYSLYQPQEPKIVIWLIRLVMFFAAWQAFSFFYLAYVFPKEKMTLPKWFYNFLIPIVVILSVSALTPLVFSKIGNINRGGVAMATPGPGIIIFGLVAVGLVLAGFFFLGRGIKKAVPTEKTQFYLFLLGVILMFGLIVPFSFILPAFFNNPRFIPLGAVFIFPFIVFTAYAIFKYHLMSIKVITTEILTFILAIVALIEVIISKDILVLVFRSGVFALLLAFGIILIRSVRKEVEQREKLEKLTKEFQAANEKLTELNKLKSEFLSFASHQIKAPMAVVKGFVSLIYDGNYGPVPETVKEKLIHIRHSVDDLLSLVGNFLDLRKIDEGRMEYNFSDVNISAMVKLMVEEFKMVAEKKNLQISFDCASEEIKAKADEEKIRQVFQNLIDNSIKYTPSGWIKVGIEVVGQDTILFSVRDSGIGISQELLPKLFEQFSRDPKAGKRIQGTGLGLYIAKQMVEAHKGQIWAESEGEGKGSKFFVKLPR